MRDCRNHTTKALDAAARIFGMALFFKQFRLPFQTALQQLQPGQRKEA